MGNAILSCGQTNGERGRLQRIYRSQAVEQMPDALRPSIPRGHIVKGVWRKIAAALESSHDLVLDVFAGR